MFELCNLFENFTRSFFYKSEWKIFLLQEYTKFRS